MSTLHTIAYPELAHEDLAFIEEFRSVHDRRIVIAPHFTLVFGSSRVGEADYTSHVASIAAATEPIEFRCRYAMLGADHEGSSGYVFLVPDEGFAAIASLHDRLHTGVLVSELRLDLPYVPHVTIGVTSTRMRAKQLCDDLNAHALDIRGSIRAVTVGSVESGRFLDRATLPLRSQSSTRG